MVTLAMSIAIGAEPIRVTEENDLLEFAVTSGELVIRRLLPNSNFFLLQK